MIEAIKKKVHELQRARIAAKLELVYQSVRRAEQHTINTTAYADRKRQETIDFAVSQELEIKAEADARAQRLIAKAKALDTAEMHRSIPARQARAY